MDLDQRVVERLTAHGGVGTVSEMASLGVSRHVIQRAVRAGHLVRLRRNIVAIAAQWEKAAPWERYALLTRATARSLGDSSLSLSHHSALAVHDIPLFAVDSRVHFARQGVGQVYSGARSVFHPPVQSAYLSDVEGKSVVSAAFAVLQVAAASGVESGLVSADALLRQSPGIDLARALEDYPPSNGRPHASLVAELADARIESAGESRCRWAMWMAGLPDPEPQVWIRAEGFAARVDFLIAEHGVVIEFDGMAKYQSASYLRAEKLREDRLRRLGYEVVRFTWKDLECLETVRTRIIMAIERSARRE
ncbi:MAG: type IV toxin-antitoxin system AbiEi family antitoxin domain-containing protein [Ornithinimicrobium sp.]